MGRGGGGGGGRGGGSSSGGSRGGSFRSSSSGGRGRGSSGGGFSGFSGFNRSYYSGGYRRHHSYGPVVHHHYSTPLSTAISGIVVLVIILIAVFGSFSGGSGDITTSTVNREKLDAQYVTLSDKWYDDSAMGWIASGKVLERGLRDFYDKTGVQPYLVITDAVEGAVNPTGDEVWSYANKVYDQMFKDEGHMVFVFQCQDGSTDYMMAAATGAQAKAVVDDEALEILYDYVDYYFYSDYDEDEFFAKSFQKAADRMMTKTTNPVIVIALVVGGVGALFVIFLIIKNVHKRQKEKAAETERILNTPVDSFGDQSMEDLKDKYDS